MPQVVNFEQSAHNLLVTFSPLPHNKLHFLPTNDELEAACMKLALINEDIKKALIV